MRKKMQKETSPAGNRTRVFHVTGGDTHHYTTEDFELLSQLLLKRINKQRGSFLQHKFNLLTKKFKFISIAINVI